MELIAIMYHYVRNPEDTPYKGIHSVRESDFIRQVKYLKEKYEMVSPALMMDFLSGQYKPRKKLCVLTFDDGLKEHGQFVTDILHSSQIKGQFFIPTACITEGYVLPVHKNHFLLASLDFEYYKKTFLAFLKEKHPYISLIVDSGKVAKTYRWDKEEVAHFKYLLNYVLPKPVRNEILKLVFEKELGAEEEFAKDLYLSWSEIRDMQSNGMLIGGHSHRHNVLSSLDNETQQKELSTCMSLIKTNIYPSNHWFFSYPFGKTSTFTDHTINCLKQEGVSCAYSTVLGHSSPETNKFILNRIDPKDIVIA
jgi:peptidoglycan/xylan/chitin deacetylase (PgdA/CDA1 family)